MAPDALAAAPAENAPSASCNSLYAPKLHAVAFKGLRKRYMPPNALPILYAAETAHVPGNDKAAVLAAAEWPDATETLQMLVNSSHFLDYYRRQPIDRRPRRRDIEIVDREALILDRRENPAHEGDLTWRTVDEMRSLRSMCTRTLLSLAPRIVDEGGCMKGETQGSLAVRLPSYFANPAPRDSFPCLQSRLPKSSTRTRSRGAVCMRAFTLWGRGGRPRLFRPRRLALSAGGERDGKGGRGRGRGARDALRCTRRGWEGDDGCGASRLTSWWYVDVSRCGGVTDPRRLQMHQHSLPGVDPHAHPDTKRWIQIQIRIKNSATQRGGETPTSFSIPRQAGGASPHILSLAPVSSSKCCVCSSSDALDTRLAPPVPLTNLARNISAGHPRNLCVGPTHSLGFPLDGRLSRQGTGTLAASLPEHSLVAGNIGLRASFVLLGYMTKALLLKDGQSARLPEYSLVAGNLGLRASFVSLGCMTKALLLKDGQAARLPDYSLVAGNLGLETSFVYWIRKTSVTSLAHRIAR
ncbi:hypothetical protein B0H11DRAFT_2257631 [Mycena galericulata]|nr:hypothetical protein B0H11DRAFT_2257631 [Mycena galericulata]